MCAEYSDGSRHCNRTVAAPLRLRRQPLRASYGNQIRKRAAQAHRRGAGAPGAGATSACRSQARRCFRVARGNSGARAGRESQPHRYRPAQGHRPDARHPDGEYPSLRQRVSRQQRAAVGRARHGQVIAGQGRAPRRQRQGGQAEACGNPPRGYREPARPYGPDPQGRRSSASSFSATISPSMPQIRPTNHSRRRWRAASKGARTT